MTLTKNKWLLPLFCVALGVLIFTAEWIGGNLRAGLYSLAAMTVFGLLILVGGRSETVRGLRGDGRDERFRMMDITASAFAGIVLISVLIGVWCVELARGHDGSPYGELLAVGGLAYLAGIAIIRLRG
jgi:drug/metabolite transporter (DMT)-like permease